MSTDRIEGLINEICKEQIETELLTESRLNQKVSADSTKVNINGTVIVINGRLVVKNPQGNGKYASIQAGPGIQIKIDGKEIENIALLTEDTKVEIVLNYQEPFSGFQVFLSPDEMKASLELKLIPGKILGLIDQQDAEHLRLTTKIIETVVPEPIGLKEVLTKLSAQGIVYGLNMDALQQELHKPSGNKVVIAQGKPPLMPEDAQIEFLFNMNQRNKKNISSKERVDYYDHGQFQSVEVGTVLALKVPAKQGRNGKSVTGREIKVSEPQDVEIFVGEGVTLLDNGRKAAAVASGRPVIVGKKREIRVLPQLTLPGDVDIQTGHIDFKGDVVIMGSIMEGLVVRATGRVVVYGHVYYSIILADGDVSVGQNLVGSTITAGGEAAFYKRVLPILQNLTESLQKMLVAVDNLKNNPLFTMQDLQIKGDGNLLKLLIDMKFKEIPLLINTLNNYLKSIIYKPQHQMLRIIELLNEKLTGLGPTSIYSMSEIQEIKDELQKIISLPENTLEKIAHVTVKYAQNGIIEATGSVYVTSVGSYHTNIYAGEKVVISGVCRGGEIHAFQDIVITELGSLSSVFTKIKTSEAGKIRIGQVFPNVDLQIGKTIYKVNKLACKMLCFWDQTKGFVIMEEQ